MKKLVGLDGMTKMFLESLAAMYPRKSIQLSHQFLDGTEGNACGFVPNDYDGSTVIIVGKWWDKK